jgi:hypothetical protein
VISANERGVTTTRRHAASQSARIPLFTREARVLFFFFCVGLATTAFLHLFFFDRTQEVNLSLNSFSGWKRSGTQATLQKRRLDVS